MERGQRRGKQSRCRSTRSGSRRRDYRAARGRDCPPRRGSQVTNEAKSPPALDVLGAISAFCDGDKGARTPDLYNANVALSQLSYTPATVRMLSQRSVCVKFPRYWGVSQNCGERMGFANCRFQKATSDSNSPPSKSPRNEQIICAPCSLQCIPLPFNRCVTSRLQDDSASPEPMQSPFLR